MKKQIRRGVFETNSSTTHSCTIMMEDDYNRWENEELYLFDGYPGTFPEDNRPKHGNLYTKSEVIEFLKAYDKKYNYDPSDYEDDDIFEDARRCEEFKSFADSNEYLEAYFESFTTPSGETVVAFGEYGYN